MSARAPEDKTSERLASGVSRVECYLHVMPRRAEKWMLGAVAALVALSCYSGGPTESAPAPRSASLTASTRRLRRLSSREYDNVVRDLLRDATKPSKTFLVDSYQNGYDNGSAGLAVQSDQVALYQQAAEALAATAVTGDVSLLLGGCDVAARGDAACVDAFLTTTAARAFRRPLTVTEADRLRAAFKAGVYSPGGFVRGVQTMLEVILQSPQFLYREELGAANAAPAPGATVELTDYEVASELSFLLTGSIPDLALWTAVADGRFTSVGDRRREASRLLETPGAKDALRAFMHQWLATDRLPTLTKDAHFYPTFAPAMAMSMSSELDLFYDDVLFSGVGSLGVLFTSNRSFADDALATLYGLPSTGSGMHPVTLDPTLRKGIMTRAGFLAVHSATDSSGPVARGVFVLDRIMCLPPPQPPANVPPVVPADDPGVKNVTTRERFAKHATGFCAGCHDQIDGVGFGFEQFDGIGAFRTTENGQPVDSSGTVVGASGIAGAYNGVAELSAKLAQSRVLADCFVKQAYRYAMGSIEPPTDDLGALSKGFDANARLTDILLAIVSSPLFVERTFESQNP